MKIFLDTNVLISAFVFGGTASKLLAELFAAGEGETFDLYVSDYVEEEFKAKLEEKWPNKAEKAVEIYKRMAITKVSSTQKILGELRDAKDIPVLSDAIAMGADIILTGDRDFLESDIEQPLIFSPAMMYAYLHRDAR